MFVRMLTAMAGDSFAHAYGQIVAVEDRIGKAWIRSGIAEPAPNAAASEKAAKDLQAQLADVEAALREAELDRDALREQIEVLAAQNADLVARNTALAAATPAS